MNSVRTCKEVLEAWPSKSMPGSGILKFKNIVDDLKNQRDEDVATCEVALMVSVRSKGQ